MSTAPNYVPAFKIVINGVELRGEEADEVSHIEVVQEPNTLDHLRVTLVPRPAIGSHRRRDPFTVFAEGSEVLLSLGYGTALVQVFQGEITGIVANFPESGTVTIEVHCHSFLHRLRGSVLTKTYVKLKDSAIAAQVARAAGLRLQTEYTETTHEFVLQYNQTNLDFLLERASRIGFEVFADGRTLHFRNAGDAGASAVTLTYGVGNDPLLSVSLREELLGQRAKVTVRAVDPLRGDPIVGSAASGQLTPSPGTARSGPSVAQKAFGATDHVVVDRPLASKQEADALALSILNGRARSFVTGSGKSIGLPSLRAGGVVRLGGVGKKFNGSYYVVQSTHAFGEDGYLTSFRLRRNAVG